MSSRTRLSTPLAVLVVLLLTAMLPPEARMVDGEDDDDIDPTPVDECSDPVIEIGPAPYLNGLPLVQEQLEIVGDQVKVYVQKPPFCHTVTPQSLAFRWQVTGPEGPVSLTAGNTLRPRFRPTTAGAYQAILTYCPWPTPASCNDVDLDGLTLDIPPRSARFDFIVAGEVPLPPETEPVLPAWATEQEDTIPWVNPDHDVRREFCGFPDVGAFWLSPQLVPSRSWVGPDSYRLVEGRVVGSRIAGHDNELNHTSHDAIVHLEPDRWYAKLKVPDEETATGTLHKKDMEIEWESDTFPGRMRPLPGDRLSAWGFHTYDCHHSDPVFGILAEIHPAVLTAAHRKRPIRIPNGWQGLGDNIYVPGIVTDIWANRHAGEMTSNCSTTGLHQRATTLPGPPYLQWGDCIQSPHPLERQFTFHVFLPPDPRTRMVAAGLNPPPVPLYLNVEPDDGRVLAMPANSGNLWYLNVIVDLTGYTGEQYSSRITAGWVQPSPDNWGLNRWKVGIPGLEIYNDHDVTPTDDGDWVLWAAVNNRDQEWTRLLNGGAVHGTVSFEDCPFETESTCASHSLGPDLLLFHPRPVDFPGSPLNDLNRSLLIHTSGYDAEVRDDEVGLVNHVMSMSPELAVPGARQHYSWLSHAGDYLLKYFVELQGPVPASLSGAGQALASAYSVRPGEAHCAPVPLPGCVIFSEALEPDEAWHPLQVRRRARSALLDWRDSPSFEPQETEELGFTGMTYADFGAAVARMRTVDPRRAERVVVEMRRPFDRVRGTRLEAEFAKSLPWIEPTLPVDLWQRHFGDIDPTPVDLAVTSIGLSPAAPLAGQPVVVTARIVNIGTGAAAPFSVQFFFDGAAARAVTVTSLGPRATITVTSPAWPATSGGHRVRVMADWPARIAEPAEGNNALERSFVVGAGP